MPYTGAKSASDSRIDGRSRSPRWTGWARRPMEISMNLIQELEKEQFDKLAATKTIPEFGPGDTVIVNVKVVEGERTRVQAYEGISRLNTSCAMRLEWFQTRPVPPAGASPRS